MKRRLFARVLIAVALVPLAALAALNEKPAKPPHISMGKVIKLEDYLVPGKTTIFDFYSDYCPPCVAISPDLEKLHARRADLVVVKVDINRPGTKGIDFGSPVGTQFKLRSIPHFKIFGPDGKLKSEDDPAYKTVVGWIRQK